MIGYWLLCVCCGAKGPATDASTIVIWHDKEDAVVEVLEKQLKESVDL